MKIRLKYREEYTHRNHTYTLLAKLAVTLAVTATRDSQLVTQKGFIGCDPMTQRKTEFMCKIESGAPEES